MNRKVIFQVIKDMFTDNTLFGIGIGMLCILIMKDVFNN